MEYNIFGKKVKIVKVKNLIIDEQETANFDSEKYLICVDASLKGNELLHAELHELIHATFNRLGIENTKMSSDLEEIIADNIPRMLIENFEVKCKKNRGA